MNDSFKETKKEFSAFVGVAWEHLTKLADAFWKESQIVYREARKDYERKKAAREAAEK